MSEAVRRAVLVIDVQQAFVEGTHRAFDVERVIAAINDLTTRARVSGVAVFFVQHESRDGPFRRGSPGWHFAEGMGVQDGDAIVAKKASDAFQETGLTQRLQGLGVHELVVCGMQADYCVDSTVRRALALGFDVTLVQDAITTIDNGLLSAAQITAHHVRTLAGIQSYPGKASVRSGQEALAS